MTNEEAIAIFESDLNFAEAMGASYVAEQCRKAIEALKKLSEIESLIKNREKIYLEAYKETHKAEYLHKARAYTEMRGAIERREYEDTCRNTLSGSEPNTIHDIDSEAHQTQDGSGL